LASLLDETQDLCLDPSIARIRITALKLEGLDVTSHIEKLAGYPYVSPNLLPWNIEKFIGIWFFLRVFNLRHW
jgi:hypothetical protein